MTQATLTLSFSSNPDCNICYQRIVEVQSVPDTSLREASPSTPSSSRKRKRTHVNESELADMDVEDEIQHFRRGQVIHPRFVRETWPDMTGHGPTTSRDTCKVFH
jgi:hypothetical protein